MKVQLYDMRRLTEGALERLAARSSQVQQQRQQRSFPLEGSLDLGTESVVAAAMRADPCRSAELLDKV